jgi:hypothetical protein
LKKPFTKKRAGGVAQGVGPVPQKKKKERKKEKGTTKSTLRGWPYICKDNGTGKCRDWGKFCAHSAFNHTTGRKK